MVTILGPKYSSLDRPMLEQQDHVKALDALYLEYGDFWCARLSKDAPFWQRWYMYSEVRLPGNEELLATVNQRQIALGEVVVDVDAPPEGMTLDFNDNLNAVRFIKSEDPELKFSVWHTGGKGVHLHFFFDDEPIKVLLAQVGNEDEAVAIIKRILLKKIVGNLQYLGSFIDFQKVYSKCPIQLEHTPHRKTDRKKVCMEGSDNWLVKNPLDYLWLKGCYEREFDVEESIRQPDIYPHRARGMRSCLVAQYAMENKISDLKQRMVYYLVSRQYVKKVPKEETLDIIKKWSELQDSKNLTPRYLEGVVNYVYIQEKFCGCKWFKDQVMTCSDPKLKKLCENCKHNKTMISHGEDKTTN